MLKAEFTYETYEMNMHLNISRLMSLLWPYLMSNELLHKLRKQCILCYSSAEMTSTLNMVIYY